MKIAIIVVADLQGGIGKKGALPWHLPGDLQHFKETTMGGLLIVGRVTDQTLPTLKGRRRIVVTSNPDYRSPDPNALYARGIYSALNTAQNTKAQKVFIAGGGQIYALAMQTGLVQEVYLTRVEKIFACDTFFPFELSNWKRKGSPIRNEENGIPYVIEHLVGR